MEHYDPTAMGSDIPRNGKQARYRRVSRALIRLFGLDRPTAFATEFCQAQDPLLRVDTRYGPFYCRGGHGRLVWRAESFFEEEPQTIEWLDELSPADVLWDVGANVGMYSIYAAKFRRCRVFAFEPEAQNYGLLLENVVLNEVGDLCSPTNVALSSHAGFGKLAVRYITRGGAYNHFTAPDLDDSEEPYTPDACENEDRPAAEQVVFGATIDQLSCQEVFAFPTHIKIDVDGLEPDIIAGALATLADTRVRSVLIEVNRNSPRHRAIPEILQRLGFQLEREKSNWDYRAERGDECGKEDEIPDVNMIFARPRAIPTEPVARIRKPLATW